MAATNSVGAASAQNHECSETTATRARDRCPECDSPIRLIDGIERVCEHCGLVLEQSPLSRQRAPVFDTTDWQTKRQTGSQKTALRVDRGLGAGVGNGYRDAKGNTLSASQRNRVNTGYWGNAVNAAPLRDALTDLQRIAAAVGVPDPERETAALLYRRASNAGLIQGRTTTGFVCACLLIAVRSIRPIIPITMESLVAASQTESEQEIANARRALVRAFDDIEIHPPRPFDYLPQIASDVAVSDTVRHCARQLLFTYWHEEGKYRGTSPVVTAAVALYVATDRVEDVDRITLEQLGNVVDIDPTTISRRKTGFVEAIE